MYMNYQHEYVVTVVLTIKKTSGVYTKYIQYVVIDIALQLEYSIVFP